MSKRITKGQIAFVTVIGSLGGIYIWKPALEEEARRLKELKEAAKNEKSP